MRIASTLLIPGCSALALLLSLASVGCNAKDHPATGGDPLGGALSDAGSKTKMDGAVRHDPGDAQDAGGAEDAGAVVAPEPMSGEDAGELACGTRGGVSCESGEFCNFEPDPDCGGTDRGGRCERAPSACTREYKPVCGCDEHSYGNGCEAHAASVSVKHAGLCSVEECASAGGRPAYSDGASQPACRTGQTEWPIGGVDEPALCCVGGAVGSTCGGIAALTCGADQFCNSETAAGGQGCDGSIADAGGKCEAQPDVCTDDFRPVCGCDRRSYGNACSAHAEGVSAMHDGQCTEIDCADIGGHAVDGIGPGPMCPAGETMHTFISYSNGMMAIEGTACCVP